MTTYSNQKYYEREPTLGELFSDLSAQAGALARQEVRLAQAEMGQKASRAGKEVALVAVGGALSFAALIVLLFSVVYLLDIWIELWLAALLVGLIVAILGGMLAWTGIQALKRMDFAPNQTITTLQEDKEWLTTQMNN